jgi:hypothetical protein
MIQNSFCPKCEEEEHGEKGKVEPPKDLDELYFDILDDDPDFKIVKVARNLEHEFIAAYGRVIGWKAERCSYRAGYELRVRVDGNKILERYIPYFLVKTYPLLKHLIYQEPRAEWHLEWHDGLSVFLPLGLP